MEICRLTKNHAEDYWMLRLEALQQNPDAFITTYEDAKSKVNPIQETEERLSNIDNHTYGAIHHHQLIGVVTMLRRPQQKFNHKADILAMYVSKHVRNQGVGESLLNRTIAEARTLGIEQLQLSVVSSNLSAKALYDKMGFSTYGIEKQAIKLENSYLDEDLMVYFV